MKSCLLCNKNFTSRFNGARYCSPECGSRMRNRRFYARHKLSERDRRADYKSRHVERAMLARVKFRAKRDGIPFNLDTTDIVIPSKCPVLGITLDTNIARGKGYHPNSPSLDRIKPHLGYVKENVRVISARANLLKNNATVSELSAVLEDLRNLHETPTARRT